MLDIGSFCIPPDHSKVFSCKSYLYLLSSRKSLAKASNPYLNLFSSITEAATIVSNNLPFNILPVVALNQQTS